MTVGKTTYEVNDALASLGIDDPAKAGIGLFSIVMPWPIDPASLVDFAKYYDEVMVVEEKRPIVEDQVARAVVNLAERAVITGKLAPDGSRLLPETGEITHSILLTAISDRANAHGIAMRPNNTARLHHSRPSQNSRAHTMVLCRLPTQFQHQASRR
jgi:indolepyruvate ferredoxin oxidoreductase